MNRVWQLVESKLMQMPSESIKLGSDSNITIDIWAQNLKEAVWHDGSIGAVVIWFGITKHR